ncbi:Na(+)/H(+) antiporter subunit C [Mycetocola manganoxydans]|uniref:Na(+)/H(+) antiporter subunit C n=1 Tax=Mycetocola manganoxydans TaxID=699879 RepID=A0A3L6ZX51_9MICO|nr:NADH-quinone oxidoreductase subunit K [Mycetocola manganoxydans]RLP72071.1 Na(+)/H(+) antiporter subunit C [Mycetocola manganoxydans]GHD47813.1 NADH-ubiquinone oxidoreductase, chain 4L precursor [Mycetocola manganoxydans]
MTASATLIILMAVLYAVGITVMLERSLTRVLIGFMLVGNATNLLILIVSGPSGTAPIVTGTSADDTMADPVPQVLMLTAIVINFGITAFVLALIYRSWWLAQLGDQGDSVPDQHTEDTEESTDATFDPVDLDDAALKKVLADSDEHPDELEHGREETR